MNVEKKKKIQWNHKGYDCAIQTRPLLGNGKDIARSHIVLMKQAPQESPDIPRAVLGLLRQWRMLFSEHFGLTSSQQNMEKLNSS